MIVITGRLVGPLLCSLVGLLALGILAVIMLATVRVWSCREQAQVRARANPA